MGQCDLCEKNIKFFAFKAQISYNGGFRQVCKSCYNHIQCYDLPDYNDSTCSGRHWLCFLAIYFPILCVFVIGMTAIGLTQCGENGDDTGCFLGMFLFGFFAGALGIIATPAIFWGVVAGKVRSKHDELTYKVFEQQKHQNDGVFAAPQFIPSGQHFANNNNHVQIIQQVPVATAPPTESHPLLSPHNIAAKNAAVDAPLPAHADDILLAAKASAPRDESDPVARLGPHDDNDGPVTCVVCEDAPRQTIFSPCGHCAVCVVCSGLIVDGLCPICRQPYTQIVKIHIA